MLHSASGFRGIRAGGAPGASAGRAPSKGSLMPYPRIRVSYWCPKGHETALVFASLPEDQIPGAWDCRRCGSAAARPDAQPDGGENPAEGYKSHLQYVKERRSSQDAEDALAGALERLRARGVFPDKLLRDP